MSELLDLARRLAGEAGQLVGDGRRQGIHDTATKSSATDMVTDWDRASERFIVEQLVRHRPADGLIGEEGASRASTSGIHWLIDPIDGTTNFLYDLPAYAVSIAACDAAGAVAGAVFVPALDWMFTAERGHGARLNDTPIRCSGLDDPATALVATGFGYDVARRRRQAEQIARLLPRIRDIRRFGAASIDLCLVACGRVDAYFEEGLGPWDVAAGGLIAAEAGATVTTLAGEALVSPVDGPATVLAAGPRLHGPMAALIADVAGKM